MNSENIKQTKSHESNGFNPEIPGDLNFSDSSFLNGVLDNVPSLIYVYDISTDTNIYVNDAIADLLGYSKNEISLSGQGMLEHIVHPQDQKVASRHYARMRAAKNRSVHSCVLRCKTQSGDWRWICTRERVLTRQEGRVQYVLGIAEDITKSKLAQNHLQQMYASLSRQMEVVSEQAKLLKEQGDQLRVANETLGTLAATDGLTGLKNHKTFQDLAQHEMVRAVRYDTPMSLALLDVDNFKAYNDSFGHPAGDFVLKTVADLMVKTMRNTDHVARYGGEEFAVILPETDLDQSMIALERLRSAIELYPWPLRQITVSIGVASCSEDYESIADLILDADKALYCAKHDGKNRVCDLKLTGNHLTGSGAKTAIQSAYDMCLAQINEMQKIEVNHDVEHHEMIEAYNSTIESWTQVLRLRDRETEGHAERVTELSVRLARIIGLNEDEVRSVRWGAMLHDIGKIGVPDSILQKPGPLTPEERLQMEKHPVLAYELLSSISYLKDVIDIPYCHHERWDGKGYPRGLKGEEIPLPARLFSVVDVWDALSFDRCYRKAWPPEKVEQYLEENAGTQFDKRAVDVLLGLLREGRKATENEVLEAA